MRKFGDVLLDLEVILDEMIDDHDIQLGDILNIVHGHIQIHRPDCIEEYEDDTNPIFFYGPVNEK